MTRDKKPIKELSPQLRNKAARKASEQGLDDKSDSFLIKRRGDQYEKFSEIPQTYYRSLEPIINDMKDPDGYLARIAFTPKDVELKMIKYLVNPNEGGLIVVEFNIIGPKGEGFLYLKFHITKDSIVNTHKMKHGRIGELNLDDVISKQSMRRLERVLKNLQTKELAEEETKSMEINESNRISLNEIKSLVREMLNKEISQPEKEFTPSNKNPIKISQSEFKKLIREIAEEETENFATRFDRHSIFDEQLMEEVHKLIMQVGEWQTNNNIKPFTSVMNKLYGLWDGYMYNDIENEAERIGMPDDMIVDIKLTLNKIKSRIQK